MLEAGADPMRALAVILEAQFIRSVRLVYPLLYMEHAAPRHQQGERRHCSICTAYCMQWVSRAA